MEAVEIWSRINALIKARNTTQNSLSVDCGFNSRRIQNLSGANRLPDAIEITKIAKALDTTVEFLVTGESLNKEDNSEAIALLRQAIEKLS